MSGSGVTERDDPNVIPVARKCVPNNVIWYRRFESIPSGFGCIVVTVTMSGWFDQRKGKRIDFRRNAGDPPSVTFLSIFVANLHWKF